MFERVCTWLALEVPIKVRGDDAVFSQRDHVINVPPHESLGRLSPFLGLCFFFV